MSALADLFGATAMERSAVILGEQDEFRVELRRIWDASKPLLVVAMLNPSTADHRIDDPTVLALIHFAKLWGYGGLLIVNLFSFRSSSPAEMMAAADPLGPANYRFLRAALDYAREHGGRALAAWGNGGTYRNQDVIFRMMARARGVDLVCLGTTQHGHPKHPMARGRHRIPRDQQPIMWSAAV